jgi:hypothetical protein
LTSPQLHPQIQMKCKKKKKKKKKSEEEEEEGHPLD